MADRIIGQLVTLGLIDREEEPIYRFGLEALVLKALHYASYLLIAVSFCEVFRFLVFFTAFTMLRKNAGGYHAKTKGGCYVGSCATVLAMLLCIKGFSVLPPLLAVLVCLSITLTGNIVVWVVAPLGNRNRAFDKEEDRVFKHRTHIYLISENLISVC